jgi:glycosyltransferase involved in cell wall biosynthesis
VRSQAGSAVSVVGRESPTRVAERMRTARALVLPSRWHEGLPMVLLEAMAAGLGVVVPGHGALPEIAGAGGAVFTGRDTPDLARVLDDLASDGAVDRLGEEARRRYLAAYSPAVALGELESVYARAMASRRGRQPYL